MPELPEVEMVRRRLEAQLCGKEICGVEVGCARLRSPMPAGLTAFLGHAHVSAVERKGKMLVVRLDRGAWLVHLGMSGRFLFGEPLNARDAKHDHLILRLSSGATVRYNDFRRFGNFAVCDSEAIALHPALSRLGIDALSAELDGDILFKLLAAKKSPIKASLLDQGLISGIGNIYASEILYWSNIHPTRASCSLRRADTHRVAVAIRQVLSAAIQSGGSTLPDYAGTTGALGDFHHHFAVFNRDGFACPRCEEPCVSKVLLRGRTTFFCPTRQK